MAISGSINDKIRDEIFRTDGWEKRRRWMKLWTLGFAFNGEVILGWMMWSGGSAYLTEIFMALLTAVVAVLFAYVFGAVWDDHSRRRLFGNLGVGDGSSDNSSNVGDRDPSDTAGKEGEQ